MAKAGSETMFTTSLPYSPESDRTENSWSQCDPSTFQLRVGPNYDRNKKKGPSPPALLECVGVDCFQTPAKVDNVGSKLPFPAEWKNVDTGNPMVPPLFIVNLQIPSEFPTTIFTITDGPGWSLVLYFRLSPEALEMARDPSKASNAMKLYVDYVSHAPEVDKDANNPYRGRFKVAVRCNNIEEFGLPSFITSYNAKPVLIRNTGDLVRGDGYVEMDINIHKFASLPKKALKMMLNQFPGMSISAGMCIESRNDGEMPETLFGCVDLNRPAIQWPDFNTLFAHRVAEMNPQTKEETQAAAAAEDNIFADVGSMQTKSGL